jgi:RNA polymerase sigma-70 factor (ECF subfamily)
MRNWESASDDDLLMATPGSDGAFSVFYRRYERAMLVFFLRRVGEPELAADLTAEVFAAALASCSRYRRGDAPASAWLFAIAQHKLAKSRRRGRVEDVARRRLGMAPVVLEDEELARIERFGAAEDVVIGLLEQLPAEQREAVRAHVLDERSYGEIAGELRCSEAVVRKRVSRGLARLREELTEET